MLCCAGHRCQHHVSSLVHSLCSTTIECTACRCAEAEQDRNAIALRHDKCKSYLSYMLATILPQSMSGAALLTSCRGVCSELQSGIFILFSKDSFVDLTKLDS